MVRRSAWFCVSFVALSATAASAPVQAGFLASEGTTQLISSGAISGFSRSFDPSGRIRRSGTFSKNSFDTHVSHGWNADLTLVGQMSSDRLMPAIINDPGAVASWSALVGARMPIWRGANSIISVQALAGVGREASNIGATGVARLMFGHSLHVINMPAFADLQLGVRFGAPGARHELRFDATFGVKPVEDWLVLAQVFSAFRLEGEGAPSSMRVKTQVSLVWQFSQTWAAQAGAFTTVFGVNSAQESGIVLGLWRRF